MTSYKCIKNPIFLTHYFSDTQIGCFAKYNYTKKTLLRLEERFFIDCSIRLLNY